MFFRSTSAKFDQSLLVKVTPQHRIYLLVYVDDILAGSDQEAINNLNKAFLHLDLGQMKYFLGIQVSILSNGNIPLSPRKYIIDLLSRAKMQYAKSDTTPTTSGQN